MSHRFFLAEVRGSNNKRKTGLGRKCVPIFHKRDLFSSDTAKDDTLFVKAGTA